MKGFVLVVLVALVAFAAFAGTGIVQAQAPQAMSDVTPAVGAVNLAPQHQGGPHPNQRDRARWAELRIIAETLNMSQQDLIAEFRSGKTVADVAAEKGVDLSTVVDALLARRMEQLQRAVDNGRLTQQQADAILALDRIRVEDRLGQPFPLDPLMIAAQVLGMEPPDLLAELRAGKSVADVAQEKGVALDDIVNAILERKVERLNQLVTDGRLTQEQADILIALERDRVTQMLNRHVQPCRCGPGRGRGGHENPGGPF